MSDTANLAPKQARSRRTLDLLLKATITTLEKEGLDACTLPHIAAIAKISAASVYRRFVDKDALLRASFLHILETDTPTQAALEKELLRPELQQTAERLIAHLFRQHCAHPHLHRARTRFLETQTDPTFPLQLQTLNTAHVQRLAAILLHHRDRIRHPDPDRAVLFAIHTAVATLESPTPIPLTDKQLTAELSRNLVAYLRRKP